MKILIPSAWERGLFHSHELDKKLYLHQVIFILLDKVCPFCSAKLLTMIIPSRTLDSLSGNLSFELLL